MVNETLLPKGYPVRRRGSCVPAAYLILKRLGRGDMVAGYVGPDNDHHTWVECDGRIIDPTIRQFSWWRKGQSFPREEVGRLGCAEATVLFEASIRQPWTDRGHLYRQFVDSEGGFLDPSKQ